MEQDQVVRETGADMSGVSRWEDWHCMEANAVVSSLNRSVQKLYTVTRLNYGGSIDSTRLRSYTQCENLFGLLKASVFARCGRAHGRSVEL